MSKKENAVIGTCALCKKENVVLEESHILPKFVSRKQKKDNITGFLRNMFEPNRRIQDGDKKYLLCGECEDLFNKSETEFSKRIFLPFVDGKLGEVHYEKWLIDFIVSVNWRNLYLDIEGWREDSSLDRDKLEIFEKGEKELREYLTGIKSQLYTVENHMFFFGDIKEAKGLENTEPHTFFRHSSFGYSVQCDDGYYVVSNLLGLILVTIIKKSKKDSWKNTMVYPKNGKVNPYNAQHVASKLFNDLFEYMKESEGNIELMSDVQKELLVESIKKSPERLMGSKLYEDRLKDKMFSTK